MGSSLKSILCLAIFAALEPFACLAQTAQWEADPQTGCKVRNPAPAPNESVTWSGACEDGLAEGIGVTQWFNNGKKGNRIEGTFHQGSPKGKVVVTFSNNESYAAVLDENGLPEGAGSYTWPNGDKYDGEFLKGIGVPSLNGRFIPANNERLAVETLTSLGARFYSVGRYLDAINMFEKIIVANDSLGTVEDKSLIPILQWIGESFRSLNQPDKGEFAHRRAVRLAESFLSESDAGLASAILFLADVCADQFKFEEAELLFKRSISLQEAYTVPTEVLLLKTYYLLASMYFNQSRFSEAELLYEKILENSEKKQSANAFNRYPIMAGLARIRSLKGKLEEAKTLHGRVMDWAERELGTKHPLVSDSLISIADILSEEGRENEALQLYNRALNLSEADNGGDPRVLASGLLSLGKLELAQRAYDLSERDFRKALKIRKEIYGPDSPFLAEILNELGWTNYFQGNISEATENLQRSLSIMENYVSIGHPTVSLALNRLALSQFRQNKFEAAEELMVRSINSYTQSFGPKNERSAQGVMNLAYIYVKQGKYLEAMRTIDSVKDYRPTGFRVSTANAYAIYLTLNGLKENNILANDITMSKSFVAMRGGSEKLDRLVKWTFRATAA